MLSEDEKKQMRTANRNSYEITAFNQGHGSEDKE